MATFTAPAAITTTDGPAPLSSGDRFLKRAGGTAPRDVLLGQGLRITQRLPGTSLRGDFRRDLAILDRALTYHYSSACAELFWSRYGPRIPDLRWFELLSYLF